MIRKNYYKLKLWIVFLSIFIVSLSFFGIVEGKTVYVDDEKGEGPENPSEDYTNILHALKNASDGDVIHFYRGVYIVNDSVVINKSISLEGENKNDTYLLIKSDSDITRDCIIEIKSENVNVSGFRIQPYNLSVDGIRVFNNSVSIVDNYLFGNVIGIFLRNASYCVFQNNVFQNNSVAGIKSYVNTDYNEISNNKFLGNFRNGLSLLYDYSTVLENNVFSKNLYFGVYLIECYNSLIKDNICSENIAGGMYISKSSSNTFSNNFFENNSKHGIFLINSDDNRFLKNRIYNHTIGINISSDSTDNIFEDNVFSGNLIDINVSENKKKLDKKNVSWGPLVFLVISIICWIVFFVFLTKAKGFVDKERKNRRKSKRSSKDSTVLNAGVFNRVLFDKKLRENKDTSKIVFLCKFFWLLGFITLLVGLILFFI